MCAKLQIYAGLGKNKQQEEEAGIGLPTWARNFVASAAR